MVDIRRVPEDEFYGADKKSTKNIKVRRVPSDQFYSGYTGESVVRPAPAPAPPAGGLGVGGSMLEMGKSNVREGARLAQTMAGAGAEMLGNVIAQHPVDIAMDAAGMVASATKGVTPTAGQVVESVRENVLGPEHAAGANPFAGAREASGKTFSPIVNASMLQQDPRIENVTYLGDDPLGAKVSRLMSDVGGVIPSQAPTIAAGVLGGPTAARAVGGSIEGAYQYEQGLQDGLSPEQAMKEAGVVGGGVAVLSGFPFDDAFKKMVPKKLQGKLASFLRAGALESFGETMEGGLDPFGQVASGRRKLKSMEDIKRFVSDVATGVWEETSVIPATFITGGAGGIMADGAEKPKAARKIKVIPPELTKEAVKLAAELEAETGDTQSPVDRLEPGPNAPTPTDSTELFEDDFVPFDMPTTAPVEPATDTTAPEPILPAPVEPEAVQVPVEQAAEQEPMSEEMRAILAEYPEVEAMLNATRRVTPEQEALEQMILNADTVDSREIPKVEVRRPVSKEESQANIIEARPVLDVGRPLDVLTEDDLEAIRNRNQPAMVSLRQRYGADTVMALQEQQANEEEIDLGKAQVKGEELRQERQARKEKAFSPEGRAEQDAADLARTDKENTDKNRFFDEAGGNNLQAGKYYDEATETEYEVIKDANGNILIKYGRAGDMRPMGGVRGGNADQGAVAFANWVSSGSIARLEEGVPQGPARSTVRAQDRPTATVPRPEVRAQVRGPEPKSKAVALADERRVQAEEPVAEAESAPFDLETMPMDRIDAFMADEDAKQKTKEREVAQRYLTPEQQEAFFALPDTEYGERRKARMFSDISDEAADAFDNAVMAEDMETAKRYRQVSMLRDKLASFTGEDEAEANKDLELFLRNANFDDPVDVRVLQEVTQRYAAAGLDVNKMLRTARAAYGTWFYEQTRDANDAMDMVASLDAKLGIPAQTEQPAPEAEFVGLQERPRGQAPIALYNIPDGNGGKTTVTAETAKERGFTVPEPPVQPTVAPQEPVQAQTPVQATEIAPEPTKDTEKLANQRQMILDMASTRGSMPPAHRKKLAEIDAALAGEPVEAGAIASMPVFGHPEATSLLPQKYGNLVPIKVRGRASIDRHEQRAQVLLDELQAKIGKAENDARKGDKKAKTYLASMQHTEDAYIRDALRNETMPELNRLRKMLPEEIAPEPEVAPEAPVATSDKDKNKRKPTDESGFGSMDLVKIPGRLFSLAKENAGPIEFKQGFGGAKPAVTRRTGKLKSLEQRAILLQKDFENAYRAIVKRTGIKGKLTNRLQQVPDALQQDINTYLEEQDPDAKAQALEALPPEMRKPAVRGRQLVDDLTDYLIAIGVVTDEQGVQFGEAKGSYLRRTYDAATDPDFKGKRDPRVVKATRDWLKKEYPNYSDSEITGIMTDLDGFGINEEATANLIKRGGVLGKLDRNTLGPRQEVPEALQEFWGVSRRGIDKIMDTVNSQAHIIANYEFLSELADTLNGTQVATAEILRDIKRGTYKGDNADEIMSWPYLNDADRIRSVKKHNRNKEVTAKQKGLDEAIARVEKLPDSVKKREALKQLKEDKAIQQRGLKRDKAGVLSVDKDNLEAAADYIEQLTAQVSALRKGDDKAKQKRLRSELDKYTRQYNAAANEGATETELPSMFGSFGPMAGARIHPDLKKALQDAMGKKESPEWVNALQMLNAQAKQNVTTRDPASAARNFQSGIDFGFANGWFLYDTVKAGKRMADALAIASVDFKRNHDPKNRETYLRATELGVTGDTAVVGDITATAKNAKKNPIARYIINKLPQTTTGLGKVDELATKIYQAGDDVFKVFGWLTETEHLMDAEGMTREQAEVEAAARVRRQFPTYSEIPRWTQSLKRFPIAGPFVAYQTETYRNTWNIMAQAVTEMKSDNPKVKAMGVRRAVGMLWAMTNRKAYLLAAAAIFGIDPDDDEAIQMTLPEFYQDHSVAVTDADKAKGVYKGYNISTMDAFNVVKEPVFAALRGDDTTEAAGNAAQALLKAYYSPELGTDLGAELITNWGGNSDSIFNASDGFFEKLFKSAAETGKTFAVPGIARRHLKADTPEKQANEIFSSLTGFKQIEANMPDSLYWMARDVAAVPREQSRDVYRKLRANDKAGAEAEIASANKTRKERFTDLHKAFTAFRKAGTNETLLNDAMKRAGLSKAMIDAVKYNQYEDWKGSETIQEAMGK